jgi:hypothetical protein
LSVATTQRDRFWNLRPRFRYLRQNAQKISRQRFHGKFSYFALRACDERDSFYYRKKTDFVSTLRTLPEAGFVTYDTV